MKKFILSLFVTACSGHISGIDNSPIEPGAYEFGEIEINFHENGQYILCRMNSFSQEAGKWNQKEGELTLDSRTLTTYSDSQKTDSSTTRFESVVAWKIMKSEFGFRRLIAKGNGTFFEEVYLKEGPPNPSCRFN